MTPNKSLWNALPPAISTPANHATERDDHRRGLADGVGDKDANQVAATRLNTMPIPPNGATGQSDRMLGDTGGIMLDEVDWSADQRMPHKEGVADETASECAKCEEDGDAIGVSGCAAMSACALNDANAPIRTPETIQMMKSLRDVPERMPEREPYALLIRTAARSARTTPAPRR